MSLYGSITNEQTVRVYEIAGEMSKAGLSAKFIIAAVELAKGSEGVYDLFELWYEEETVRERENIIADIQKAIREEMVY